MRIQRNIRLPFRTIFSFQAIVCFSCAILLSASNATRVKADLVLNGDFEIVGTNGPTTTHSGTGGVGPSAAANWGVFHQITNPSATTETNWKTYTELLIPTILGSQDPPSDHVLRVETSHHGNGIVQTFSPFGTGPNDALGSIWIFVNGANQQVGVGIGNGGLTQWSAFTSTTGQWEQLTFNNLTSPVNEMTIFASGGAAEFYVDFASVSAVPEPCSGSAGLVTGILALAFRRKRVIYLV